MDACVPVCQEFKYSIVVDIGHWHLQPFMNSNFHFLITLEFHDLHCSPVAHINGSLMVQGQDCKVDGPEVCRETVIIVDVHWTIFKLPAPPPYMLRCGHHYTAVSGGEFHWTKHLPPIKTEPLYEQLCWTKFSVTAVAHQLFPWIACDWLLCHLLHVTATTSAASTENGWFTESYRLGNLSYWTCHIVRIWI